jgi:hypothetical protein
MAKTTKEMAKTAERIGGERRFLGMAILPI